LYPHERHGSTQIAYYLRYLCSLQIKGDLIPEASAEEIICELQALFALHNPPWNGRHRGVLGIEDVTAYFHLGLAASLADNPWRKKGIPTAIALGNRKCTRIPYIMGVAALPDGFDTVSAIRRTDTGIRLHAAGGPHMDQ
jgi:hypothetical protein